ncbi:uncharacterized protein BJ171DRAFT_628618 [Polychytrium aggregatum]|uniref:uncharacterized protein n=1 Tax=Polychytrium aggregatum TaxID=110093 RepID=UPI0022FDB11E|nr:uncharacterized protein BJ171DRAFT_628618 [Polychytrium aggregatum]KAI9202222.1 hypothetical protein BJ171DRAFT_628618 [Polychytrium aggregatum]
MVIPSHVSASKAVEASWESSLSVRAAQGPPVRSWLDKDMREVVIRLLANDFLNVSDLSLDTRAYLVETALPALILALEKLLREAEKRNAFSTFPMPATGGEDHSLVQPDRPNELPFSPLNWLAQYLYRNNPRYANFTDTTGSPYLQAMHTVNIQLKARLFELETNNRARKRAEELARIREEARRQALRTAQMEERRRMFIELLENTFRSWTAKLWRVSPGFLFHEELMEAYKVALLMEDIQLNPEMLDKVMLLIQSLLEGAAKSSNPFDQEPPATSEGESAPSTQSRRTSNALGPLDAPSSIVVFDRWDISNYVDVSLKLMKDWSVDELSVFLRSLVGYIDQQGEALKSAFEQTFFMPEFPDLDLSAPVDQWKSRFLGLVESINLTGPDAAEIKEILAMFCEDDLGLAQNILELEAEYRSFLKRLTGNFGIKVFRSLMQQLHRAFNKLKITYEANKAQMVVRVSLTEARKMALGDIYTILQELSPDTPTGQSGVAIQFNIIVGRVIESGCRPDIMKALQDIRLPSDKPILRDDFISHYHNACSLLKEDAYDEALQRLAEETQIEFENFQAKQAADQAQVQQSSSIQTRLLDRAALEQKALERIRDAAKRWDLTVAAVCDIAIESMTNCFDKLHENHDIQMRVSLMETGMTRAPDDEDAPITPGMEAEYLRYISCSPAVRDAVLGLQVHSESAIEYDIIRDKRSITMEDIRQHASFATVEGIPTLMSMVGRFLGAPIFSDDARAVGVLDITMTCQNSDTPAEIFDDLDLRFVETAISELSKVLYSIDIFQKSLILARSTANWIAEQGEGEVEIDIYIPPPMAHKGASGEGQILLKIEENPDGVELTSAMMASPFMRPNTFVVHPVVPGAETVRLFKAQETLKVIDEEDPESHLVHTTIPVIDEHGQCAAVIDCRPTGKPKTGEIKKLQEGDLEDIKRAVRILTNAIDYVHKDHFAKRDDASRLDAENIDDEARRDILFSKMMLLSARESLANLDSQAISELRSYKKPPATVLKIIQAVLYIFGKHPKDVKTWPNAVKFVNMDLLKQMVLYDPTAVQKKIRFKRVKKVLKTIPHGDVKARGSKPAQHMFDWLVVSLTLRQKALDARKRRADLFAKQKAAAEAEGEEDEDETLIVDDSRPGTAEGGAGAGQDDDIVLEDDSVVATVKLGDQE